MSSSIQQFVFALIAQLLIPLSPLIIEFWITGGVQDTTLSITAAIYSISIGLSSRNIPLLGFGMLVCIIFSALFGFIISGNTTALPVRLPACVVIFSFIIIHTIERFRRHVISGEIFLNIGASDV